MILYLIKSGLCLLVVFAIYHFALGSEKMYRFNRYFLLFGLAFGLLIPLNTIKKEVTPVAENTFATTITEHTIQPAIILSDTSESLALENILIGLYLTITSILLLRFMKNLIMMFSKIRSSKKIFLKEYTLVLTAEKMLPHTFLNHIFMNEDDFNHNKIEAEVIEHEKAHAQQLHSIDIMFVELLQVFFWLQPTLYGFKKAIQFNHEFLADEAVLQKNTPTENYQKLILAKITHKKPVPFSSNLAYLVTKKTLYYDDKTHVSA